MLITKKLSLFWRLLKKLFYKISKTAFVKQIFFFYIATLFIGSSLLYASFANHKHINFLDALFVATSAFSDTGLSTINISETFNEFGQAIISILILIGGIGWFALKVYIINIILGRPISFITRNVVALERGTLQTGYAPKLIKVSITFLLITILVATFVLSLMFNFLKPNENPFGVTGESGLLGKNMIFENPYHNYAVSFRFGLFHSISAINNAGLDILGNNSFAPYYYQSGIQIVFIILFIMGGLGFPVFYDVFCKIQAMRKKQVYKWTLFTKVSLSAYSIVTIFSLFTTFMSEAFIQNRAVLNSYGNKIAEEYSFWQNPMYGNKSNKAMALIFNSLSTRNAGFSTIRMGDLSSTTNILFSIFMFIGSSPSSTAGGIRTTTLAVIFCGIVARMRNMKSTRIFNRNIPKSTVNHSYVVFTISIVTVFVTALVVSSSLNETDGAINSSTERMFHKYILNNDGTKSFMATRYDFTSVFFEANSAFGTTGLSVGITPMLNEVSKLFLILTMFIGQLGVSSSILVFGKKKSKRNFYEYVEEDLVIG